MMWWWGGGGSERGKIALHGFDNPLKVRDWIFSKSNKNAVLTKNNERRPWAVIKNVEEKDKTNRLL